MRLKTSSGLVVALALGLTAAIALGGGDVSAAGPPTGAQESAGDTDSRPIIRLQVRNDFKPKDTVLPLVVQGRLISDLADMETFRVVAADRKGDFLLTCAIRNIEIASGEPYRSSPEIGSVSGAPARERRTTVTMDMDLRLEDGSGKEIYTGKLSAQASQEFEGGGEHTLAAARQELIDRAAQRLEKILRKKLKRL